MMFAMFWGAVERRVATARDLGGRFVLVRAGVPSRPHHSTHFGSLHQSHGN